MIKVKHLRHPVRTVAAARSLLEDRLSMRRLALLGRRRFASDPRYDLCCVTDGFAASRSDDLDDDTPILRRVVSAWAAAVHREQEVSECYRPTAWWNDVRRASLGPVRDALRRGDISALGAMYRRFYRDPCSTGLISVPWGMRGAYFGGVIRDRYRHLYLSNALSRLDYWREQVGPEYPLSDLAAPGVGQPFGVLIDDVLVRAGSDYQHYCAHVVLDMLPSGKGVVVEIGGGFGGAAYYLLRNNPGITYINLDVPESLALAAYYLMKSLPGLSFQLCGEGEVNPGAIRRANVFLLPLQEIEQLPDAIAQAALTSHAISDLSPATLPTILAQLARITRGHLFYAGSGPSYTALAQSAARVAGSFSLTDVKVSRWNRFYREQQEIECIYRITGDDTNPSDRIAGPATADSPEIYAADCLQEAGGPAERPPCC